MHNLHFARIRAKTGEEACHKVDRLIEEWGDCNNWRSFCGAVSEGNEVYSSGEGRFGPIDCKLTTVDLINECCDSWVQLPPYGEAVFKRIKRLPLKDIIENTDRFKGEFMTHELWSLGKFSEWLYHTSQLRGSKIDCLKDAFYDYDFGECGLTGMDDGQEPTKGPVWIVFIDMHT